MCPASRYLVGNKFELRRDMASILYQYIIINYIDMVILITISMCSKKCDKDKLTADGEAHRRKSLSEMRVASQQTRHLLRHDIPCS